MKKLYIHTLCLSLVLCMSYFIATDSSYFTGMGIYLLGMVITAWVLYALISKK